ncbi:hypothetical protein [Amycolatopsis magusensis]|uniref:hypothetical protein n=1 Tax=Amycolatopsis magusensis TaxID=882444 RepID=UPI0024A8A7D8|nr:hypothetical protein [Amycolatopsis magusensis]MDI5980693.1 hypothetical protein [Amycolatopsis magusensis]
MRKILSRGAIATAVVGAGLVLAPPMAMAGPESATCSVSDCDLFDVPGFPGGTISVDADVHGVGIGRWYVWGPNGYSCTDTFHASAGPGSWVCHNAPAGTYSALVEGPQGPSSIGLRW